jgi:aldose 1-epimerase
MNRASIQRTPVGRTAAGELVDQFTLTSRAGVTVGLMTYGASATHIFVPDRLRIFGDVVLALPTLDAYESDPCYVGATIGRVANRIAHAKFTLDGAPYALEANEGRHHLHGGSLGYHRRIWTADTADTAAGPAVRFKLRDPDGAGGYPGTVDVTVVYTLVEPATLRVAYHAVTDRATPLNLTNHSYFNLAGPDSKLRIDGHVLHLDADRYTPVDAALIPTGEIAPVAGTPLNFTTPRPIGPTHYDHNLVLARSPRSLTRAALVTEPISGRTMEIWTTEPGLQFYTMGPGSAHLPHGTFCLETQRWPDAVHHPHFPPTIVRPGEHYQSITEYRFDVAG